MSHVNLATLETLRSILTGIDAQHKVRDGWECAGCGTWAPIGHPEAHAHRDECPEIARVVRERDTRGRLRALIARLQQQEIPATTPA